MYHVVKACVAFPETLKPWRTIALSVQVAAELGDDDHGVTERESFFLSQQSQHLTLTRINRNRPAEPSYAERSGRGRMAG